MAEELGPDGPAQQPSLGALVRRRREDILARWREAVSRLGPARGLSERRLTDHFPELLEQLAAELEGQPPGLAGMPEVHALERLEVGFDLEAVAREYAVLRRVVLELCAEAGARPPTLPELLRLNAALDEAVATSVARYARARERTLVALDRISTAALEGGELEQLLPRLLQVFVETTGSVDTVAILLREGEELVVRAAVGLEAGLAERYRVRVGEGFAGRIARERAPLALRVASTDPLVRSPAIRARGVRALYGVPLLHGDEVLGVAHVGSVHAFEFSNEDKLLFRTMVGRAAALLVQARHAARERELQQAAAENLARVEALVGGATTGVAFVDRELRYLHVNEALARLAGLPARAHVGRRVEDVVPPALREETVARIRRVLTRGEPLRGVEVGDAAAGTAALVDYFPVRTPDGHVQGVGVVAVDISDRKRAEQEREAALAALDTQKRLLDAVVEQLPVGVALAEAPSGRLTFGNAVFERIWRMPLQGARSVADYHAYKGFHPGGRALAPEEWPLARALSGETVRDQELDIVRGDGTWGTVLASAAPIRDAAGRVPLAVATVVDLTERKATEVQLARAAEFRERFLGIVSHDLRNPLNAILLSGAALLRDEALPERATRAVRRIAASAERMHRLVRDLLDFTRGRLGGGIPLARAGGDLRRVVRGVLDELELAYPTRALRLEAEGQFGGEWDADRLAQLVQNLVKNALDYSPPDTPVTVALHDEGPSVRLTVHNLGEPIPRELLPTLFEPFRRGREAREGEEGLGLGLYIAEQIALAHGGVLEVESTRQEGTRFTARLPRRGAPPGP